MTSYAHPFLCLWCRHSHEDPDGAPTLIVGCDAFAEGIPNAIFDNEVDHRRPVEGDGGITFVPSAPRFASAEWSAYIDRMFEERS